MKDEEMIPDVPGVTMDQTAILQAQIDELRHQHRVLDDEIAAITDAASVTAALEIRRLKKRKLALKDAITRLDERLLPDIIA